MALPFPLVNGTRYDHSSLDVRVVNTSFIGIKALDYEDSLEGAEVRGTSVQQIADTNGQYKCTASIEVWKDEFDQFAQLIVGFGINGQGLFQVKFPIDINYIGGDQTKTDNLAYVRVTKVHSASSNGTDPLSVKVDLKPFYLIRNGILPFAGLRK